MKHTTSRISILALLCTPITISVPRTRSPKPEAYIPTLDYSESYTRQANKQKEKNDKPALMTANALQFFTGLLGVAFNKEDKEKQQQHLTSALSGIANLLCMAVKYNPNALRSEHELAQSLHDMFKDPRFMAMLTAQVERKTLTIMRYYAKQIVANPQK